jgi:hypothetical protein
VVGPLRVEALSLVRRSAFPPHPQPSGGQHADQEDGPGEAAPPVHAQAAREPFVSEAGPEDGAGKAAPPEFAQVADERRDVTMPTTVLGGDREGPPPATTLADMPYDSFLAERQKIVDARQRAQQRVDQIINGGAAGALVLSITFADSLAAAAPKAPWLLPLAWTLLLVTLGLNFVAHFLSQWAFDRYLSSFDAAYQTGRPCSHDGVESKTSRVLDVAAAVSFVSGIALLGAFALTNLSPTTTHVPDPPAAVGTP